MSAYNGGSTPTPVPNANPNGYYDNTGTATLNSGNVSDLQGIIHNNRLMMLSVATGLSYDGTITITGNDYSGTLSVYDDGSLLGTAPVTGSITQGVRVTGNFSATAIAGGSGAFTLNYASSNSEVAALGRVENAMNWEGLIGGSTAGYEFDVNSIGAISHARSAPDGVFVYCNMNGTISPIASTNLYSVNVTLSSNLCDPAVLTAGYTGLATTVSRGGTDNILVMIATNGSYSVASEFIR